MNTIKTFWKEKPLKTILILAIVTRLVAAVFSGGYGFHDDHFLVFEVSQCWIDDTEWYHWLPSDQESLNPGEEPKPEGHSLIYPGIHYVIFSITDALGFDSPVGKAFLMRLLHALLSLITIVVGYRITLHYAHERAARLSGLLLAVLWCMPFLSVRTMVEIVAVPFIMLGLWELIKNEKKDFSIKPYLLAGFYLGIAFSFRFQAMIIVGGAGLVLLFRKQWREAFLVGAGVLLSAFLTQGIIDWAIWGKPFAEFMAYVEYNITHRYDYGNNIYYMYITVLGGIVIPPLGAFLIFGWFKSLRKIPLLFWPSFLFFAFHTYFVNKQERFILPILPLFIVAGIIGWFMFMDKNKFLQKHTWIFKYSMVFFWVLNFLVLPIISTTYSKRSRCETMIYFQDKDVVNVLSEETRRGGVTMFPVFYAGKNINFYDMSDKATFADVASTAPVKKTKNHHETINSPQVIAHNNWPEPEYIAFINERDIDDRIERMRKYYPNMEHEKTINPSYIDLIMRKMTPSNNNQLIFLYRTNVGNK